MTQKVRATLTLTANDSEEVRRSLHRLRAWATKEANQSYLHMQLVVPSPHRVVTPKERYRAMALALRAHEPTGLNLGEGSCKMHWDPDARGNNLPLSFPEEEVKITMSEIEHGNSLDFPVPDSDNPYLYLHSANQESNTKTLRLEKGSTSAPVIVLDEEYGGEVIPTRSIAADQSSYASRFLGWLAKRGLEVVVKRGPTKRPAPEPLSSGESAAARRIREGSKLARLTEALEETLREMELTGNVANPIVEVSQREHDEADPPLTAQVTNGIDLTQLEEERSTDDAEGVDAQEQKYFRKREEHAQVVRAFLLTLGKELALMGATSDPAPDPVKNSHDKVSSSDEPEKKDMSQVDTSQDFTENLELCDGSQLIVRKARPDTEILATKLKQKLCRSVITAADTTDETPSSSSTGSGSGENYVDRFLMPRNDGGQPSARDVARAAIRRATLDAISKVPPSPSPERRAS